MLANVLAHSPMGSAQVLLIDNSRTVENILKNIRNELKIEGLKADGQSGAIFAFQEKRIEHLSKHGPERVMWEMQSARDVLADPDAIFEGLGRKNHEKSLCYVGRPKEYGPYMEQPPSGGLVFVVFVTCKGIIFEWRWDAEEKGEKGMPVNWKSRFKNRIWKR
jgi:hypothetical protein